jgi:X-X-X-Leu-X-X-Gly heptad repeat protein
MGLCEQEIGKTVWADTTLRRAILWKRAGRAYGHCRAGATVVLAGPTAASKAAIAARIAALAAGIAVLAAGIAVLAAGIAALAAGIAALAAGTAVAGAAAQHGETQLTCANLISGTSWQIRIDYDRSAVDSNPARIDDSRISWHDAKDGGNYTLDRKSGNLTVVVASSTGGFFLYHRCNLEN